jgi:hypothetical protein
VRLAPQARSAVRFDVPPEHDVAGFVAIISKDRARPAPGGEIYPSCERVRASPRGWANATPLPRATTRRSGARRSRNSAYGHQTPAAGAATAPRPARYGGAGGGPRPPKSAARRDAFALPLRRAGARRLPDPSPRPRLPARDVGRAIVTLELVLRSTAPDGHI